MTLKSSLAVVTWPQWVVLSLRRITPRLLRLSSRPSHDGPRHVTGRIREPGCRVRLAIGFTVPVDSPSFRVVRIVAALLSQHGVSPADRSILARLCRGGVLYKCADSFDVGHTGARILALCLPANFIIDATP